MIASVASRSHVASASSSNSPRLRKCQIEQAEAELAAVERELADPQARNDPRSAAKSTERHADAKARVEALYAELETVAG